MGKIWIQNQTKYTLILALPPGPYLILELSFNLNSSRISFEHRRVTFGLSSSGGVFPTNRNMKIPGIPWRKDGTTFLCYFCWHDELETVLSLWFGVGRKLPRTLLLSIWHRLGNLIGNKCNIRRVIYKRETGFPSTTGVPCTSLPD